ncbi:hypothetical protein PVQ44_02075 [Staphylococcus aureus]|nr:hypothetical protein [Staphylococcus aureus]MDD9181212.1 hypothetical protein [Staphylococcus aureus]
MQRNNTCKRPSIIWRPPNIQEAKRNKRIQRNDKSRWHSIIRSSSDTKQAKRNERI